MKKIAIFLIAMAASTFAQDMGESASAPRLQVEPLLGVGYTMPWGYAANSLTGGLSYSAGVQSRINLGEVSVLPGLLYSSKSAEIDITGVTGSTTLAFIEIPILAAYTVMPGLNVLAGPQLWSNLGGESKLTSANGSEQTVKADDNLTALGFSALVGAEYTVTKEVNVSVRYDYQFSDQFTNSNSKGGLNEVAVFASYGIGL